MFTGIVEAMGEVVAITTEGSNRRIHLRAPWSSDLKVDQSVAHDGVCLTIDTLGTDQYTVVAIAETLSRSTLGQLNVGDLVNLERCLHLGARLDGHLVQGHVDTTLRLLDRVDEGGSWRLRFDLPAAYAHLVIDKGSICLNGVSLTVVNPGLDSFSVAIIPYTWQHTTLHRLQIGDSANAEFDLLGKYLHRWRSLQPAQD